MVVQESITQASSLDIAAIAANASILIVFIGAVIAGVYKGLKELRSVTPTKANVAAAMLLETVSLQEWSNSNLEVARALSRLTETLDDHRQDVRDNTRQINENIDELRTMRKHLNAINPR